MKPFDLPHKLTQGKHHTRKWQYVCTCMRLTAAEEEEEEEEERKGKATRK